MPSTWPARWKRCVMPERVDLQRFIHHVDALDRNSFLERPALASGRQEPVTRTGGDAVGLDALAGLKTAFADRRREWDEKPERSDRWLAPRLHWSLRLSR